MTTYRYDYTITNPGVHEHDRACDSCYRTIAPGALVHYFKPDNRNRTSLPLCDACSKAGKVWDPKYIRVDFASFKPRTVLVWGPTDASWTERPIEDFFKVTA